MTITLRNLQALYKAFGLSAPTADTLERRIKAAPSLNEAITGDKAEEMIHLVLRTPRQSECHSWLFELFQKQDPTFDADIQSPEFSLLVSAILEEFIKGNDEWASFASLELLTGAFGGSRVPSESKWLIEVASQKLLTTQRAAIPTLSKVSPPKKLDISAKAKELETAAAQNTTVALAPAIVALFSTTIDHLAASNKSLVEQMNQLADGYLNIRKEVDWHWWALNEWSIEAEKSFSSLSTHEAILRSASELANLTDSKLGSYMAPILLSYVLRGKAADEVSIASLAEELKPEWFKGRIPEGIQNREVFFCPFSYALLLSAEFGEMSAWQRKFEQDIRIPLTNKLSALDAAVQIYRELTLLKG